MSEYQIWRPMKYSTARNAEVLAAALRSSDYGLQLKKDGSSYVWAKDSDGTVHLYGDRISKKTGEIIDKIDNVPHLKAFADSNFPKETQILVEICWGETSKDVNQIMLANPEKAIARQKENGWVDAYMFDVLYWDGLEAYKEDAEKRIKLLEETIQGKFLETFYPDWLSVTETIIDNKQERLEKWLSSGEEGGVLKLLRSNKKTSAAHHVREIGTREARPANTTFKVKQIDSLDVVITGIQLPDKTYTGDDPTGYAFRDENDNPVNRLYFLGMINGFHIGAYDETGQMISIGTVASGLTDEIRQEAMDSPESFIGRVIEVRCMSKDKLERTLRHPRLYRFRDDKGKEECQMEEIFA